jgi:hypothetical protein
MAHDKKRDLDQILAARERFLDSDLRLGDELQEYFTDRSRGNEPCARALQVQDTAYGGYRQTILRVLGMLSHPRPDTAKGHGAHSKPATR